jgi:hypothetical protein
MKKTLQILEFLTLIPVGYSFTWIRFEDHISQPMSVSFTLYRVVLITGITVAILLRIQQIARDLFLNKATQKAGLRNVLILYVLSVSLDLWVFLRWNFIAHVYFVHTTILLLPIFLMISQLKIKTHSNKS